MMEIVRKLLDKHSLTECDYPIIPELFLHFLRVFGLFPRKTQHDADHCVKRLVIRYKWHIWSILLGTGLTAITILQIVQYCRKFADPLHDLEFFTLIAFAYRLVIMSQAGFAIVAMLLVNCRLTALIRRSDAFMKVHLSKQHLSRLRRFSIAVILWTLLSVVTGIITKSIRTAAIAETQSTDWHTKLGYFMNFFHLPRFLHVGVYAFGALMNSSGEYFPSVLLMILSLHYGAVFDQLAQRLAEVEKVTADSLKETFRTYATTVKLVEIAGRLFGPLLLMVCFRDMMTWAALSGTLLQVEKRNYSLSAGNLTVRAAGNGPGHGRNLEVIVMVVAIGAMVNGLLRILIFCSVHNKAQKVRNALQCVALTSTDDSVSTECQKISAYLKVSDGAFSVCGLFVLTKDYVVAFGGLAITYFVFIYQTRDSRKDMEEVKEILHTHGNLIRRLTNGDVVDQHRAL
ncbi:uncharacterized protein LOC129601399 [Paramacrobiotus metropolitanus]|uniref:uncharacterized protein LOC129601399 n=1 Tax=Paramacrobiotus metropolitanus TaxID=2943436 RepID=UPI00244602D5|nr:uncharacterized protein LOC129601399 [Paramacrobiotus metropolitanus]